MQKSVDSFPSLFKSKANENAFQNAYDSLLESWGVITESQWVRSDFGDTHVITAGPLEGEPLVLIPGIQGTAGMWGPLIPKIIEKRRVYAFDLVDQVGRSRPTRILKNSRDSVEWMKQTLDGLNLSKVDIVGNSLGSYMTARFALHCPERVSKIILTAPAATVSDISLFYILRILVTLLLPFDSLKERFLRQASAHNVNPSSPLFRLMAIAMSGSRIISKVIPSALTDAELSTLKMPTLLVLGERDPANKVQSSAVYGKLERHIPDLQCEVIPGAGHLWNEEQFQECGRMIDNFLG